MIKYFQDFLKITENLKENQKIGEKNPKLLLHSCCAPCSSSSLEAVVDFFDVDVFYFNPNITDEKEYYLRVNEQKTFLSKVHKAVQMIEGDYEPQMFYEAIKGLENQPERGSRCFVCYRLRLEETAKKAKNLGYDFFATTLTLSPLKNSDKLNEIGLELQEKYGVKYLPTDFKKRDGYKRSIELSNEYNLYRQNYCGCEFSKRNDLIK